MVSTSQSTRVDLEVGEALRQVRFPINSDFLRIRFDDLRQVP